MDPDIFVNKGFDHSKKGFRDVIATLKQKLKDKKNVYFVEHLNFSITGKVVHAHIYYLEWLYGSVYRKKTEHYFLLFDFDVGKHELKEEHKHALSDFFNEVYLDELLKHSALDAREFEKYKSPFIANIKESKKERLLNTQLWGPADYAGRDNLIRYQLLNSFKSRGESDWWQANNIVFPDPQGLFDPGGDGNADPQYPPFAISDLLFWRRSPQSIENFSRFIGRASETGNNSINDPLSQARADVVVGYLNELSAELSNYMDNTRLELKSIGAGSRQPIILNDRELEIAENRSVQFSFYQEHDYVHLLSPETLKDQYRANVNGVNADLTEKIDYLESYLSNPDQPFQLPGLNQEAVLRSTIFEDVRFSLGMSSIFFAKAFEGDFRDLNGDAGIPNNPAGIGLSNQSADPGFGNRSVVYQLPITDMISRGAYSTRNSDVFRMPLSPRFRLEFAEKTFRKIKEIMVAKSSSDASPAITARNYIDYYKTYIRKPHIAHSFLMRPMTKEKFLQELENYQWEFRIDFTGDHPIYRNRLGDTINLTLNLINNGFMNGGVSGNGFIKYIKEEISDGRIREFYWFDPSVAKFHAEMKGLLAKNLLKMVVLSNQPALRLKYTGAPGRLAMPPFIEAAFRDLVYLWIFPSIGEADY
ncbi:MAG TPA: hypothetical protein PK339_09445 [Flavitalea sp.]|nr:hypothetical protein [Flavitalea sp.]